VVAGFVEGELLDIASMLEAFAVAGMVENEAAHLTRGEVEEVQAVFAIDGHARKERQIQLIH
jgi:hypothetical protein